LVFAQSTPDPLRIDGNDTDILLVLVAGSTAIATMEPIKKSIGYQLGTATGAGAISQQDTSEANMHASLSPVITDEIKINDS
jgi:hypothetical protein